jgi:hypothetical protein
MRGAITPLPNTPSWRGAWLSTGTTLHLLLPLCLGLPSGPFPSGVQIKLLYAFLISIKHATCPAHLILLELMNSVATVFSEPDP